MTTTQDHIGTFLRAAAHMHLAFAEDQANTSLALHQRLW